MTSHGGSETGRGPRGNTDRPGPGVFTTPGPSHALSETRAWCFRTGADSATRILYARSMRGERILILMLPLFELSECQTCGHEHQGTRAKAGNSVACAGCGTMRRVPTDRPTAGPDDSQATRPVRGRPLKTGNRWRYQSQDSAPRPAPVRSSSADRTASAMDTFREIMSRLAKNPDLTVELTTDVGDGSDCKDVVRLAHAFDQKKPQAGLYWEASKGWKKVRFWIERDTVDTPVPSISRTNMNQSQRVVPNKAPIIRERRNYVNPLTCSHPEWSFDAGNNVYQCRDCSHVISAQDMRIARR